MCVYAIAHDGPEPIYQMAVQTPGAAAASYRGLYPELQIFDVEELGEVIPDNSVVRRPAPEPD